MYPYIKFFQPEEIGYTADMRKSLLDLVNQPERGYSNYISPEGQKIELEFCLLYEHDSTILDEPEIIKIMRGLIQPHITIQVAGYIRFLPGAYTIPHVDDYLRRTTVLTFPLTPEPKWFAPTIFYKQNETKPDKIIYWNGLPGLLNTRETHAVYNNKHTRQTFQICFSESFAEVVDLYGRGKLFTSQLKGNCP